MRTRVLDRSEAGFTLVEALAALFLLTISLMALAQLMLVALQQHELAKYDTKALNLAQAKLEELRTAYGNEIESGITPAELAPGDHGPEAVELSVPEGTLQGTLQFRISWRVTEISSGRKEVVVTVAPNSANPRQTETLTLTTQFSP
ncbi:MAG TPA: prepilin-type N-terminal cleavage/methylation domain-containing protein [Acidobacteriota bacterium]|nr:prepilin-type N-terminal cleavage/methylation domain-containing protein [Acidobacteriota bacterium]